MSEKQETIAMCLFGEGEACDPTCDRFRACWGEQIPQEFTDAFKNENNSD